MKTFQVISIVAIFIIIIIIFLIYEYIYINSPNQNYQGGSQTVNSIMKSMRLISLAPSDTQILISLGLGRDLVGIDDNSYSLLKELNETFLVSPNVSVIISYPTVNISQLLLLKPTYVIAEQGLASSYARQLIDSGLNVIFTNNDYASNFYQIENGIMDLAKRLNRTSEGQELVNWMNSQLQRFTYSGQNTTAYILWIDNNYNFYTIGGNTFISNIISLAGGVNVFSGQINYPYLGPSQLIISNPQVIMVSEIYNYSYTMYLINTFPGIKNVSAYQNGNVYVISGALANGLTQEPGPLAVYSIPMINMMLQGKAPHYINSSWVMKTISPSIPVFT
jgi:iron complex transport system substrate-binding protein